METQVIKSDFHKEVISNIAKLQKYSHYAINQKLDFLFLHFPEYADMDQDGLLNDLDQLWPTNFEYLG